MMASIIPDKRKRKKISWWSVVVWLAVWQVVAMAVGQNIILASPIEVVRTLFALMKTGSFYASIWFSFVRIAAGFFLAVVVGIAFAAGSYRCSVFENLVEPLMRVIKSIPVASFIIMILVWISSRSLSIAISFLIVLPVVYSNVLEGFRQTDFRLLEMAKLFRVKPARAVRYIYVPQVMPYFKSACTVGLGLAWKSGIAAEVIGMPLGSMGEQLYQSKIFLDTPSLLAWTVAIVLVSYAFEKIVILLISIVQRKVVR